MESISSSSYKTSSARAGYASASEVIRDALRLLEDHKQVQRVKLEGLRAEIQKGFDSGGRRPSEEVFAAVRARIDQIVTETAQG